MVRRLPSCVHGYELRYTRSGLCAAPRARRDTRGAWSCVELQEARHSRRFASASAQKRGCRRTRAAGPRSPRRTSNLSCDLGDGFGLQVAQAAGGEPVGERLAAAAPHQAARQDARLPLPSTQLAHRRLDRPLRSEVVDARADADHGSGRLAFHAVDREAPVPARTPPPPPRRAGAAEPAMTARSQALIQRSNRAMLSTCAVCGNMLTTPAAASRKPFVCTRMPASRASVAGSHET